MNCPKCHLPAELDSDFCEQCGISLGGTPTRDGKPRREDRKERFLLAPLKLIRDIYFSPREAFRQENLEGMLGSGIVASIVIMSVLIGLGAMGVVHINDPRLRLDMIPPTHLLLCILVLSAIAGAILVSLAWVTSKVAAYYGESLNWKEYLTGTLWIITALTPISGILAILFGYPPPRFPMNIWWLFLSIICIQSLTKASRKRATWIYFLSLIIYIAIAAVLWTLAAIIHKF